MFLRLQGILSDQFDHLYIAGHGGANEVLDLYHRITNNILNELTLNL